MNDLETPPVPTLSDFRLSTRQEHLVREITGRRRNRRRGGVALGGGALVASGVTSALLVLAGPGTANAFAAWTAAPTTPPPGQVSSAEATCEATAAAPPSDKTAGLATGATQVSLVDTRGPFTLVLFGANTPTPLICVSGPSINSSAQANSQMREIGNQSALPEAGQIAVDRLQADSADGQPYAIAEGSVGSGVTAATLVLSDGSDVVTTIGNGLFLAWWPGSAVVASATVTTAAGTTTQPISSSTPDTSGSGNSVERNVGTGQ
jgi:hypothetical protein